MRGIWRTNPKGDTVWPNWVALRAAGVIRIYIPLYYYDTSIAKFVINQAELTPEYKEGVNSQGFEYATYNCWNWQNAYSDPLVMVQDAVDIMDSLGTTIHMYNDETHSSVRITQIIRGHRRKKPRGPISWALEGMQGGWFTKSLCQTINSDPNCVVLPEAFYGDMSPIPVDKVRRNLITAGINGNRTLVFLDGSKPRPANWNGCILSEENLV